MSSYRIGFGSDFNLRNQLVGVGTTTASVKLEVDGTIKGDFNIAGVSTLTSYSGFAAQKQDVTKESTTGISTVGVGTFVQSYETETGNLELVGQFNTVSEDIIVDEGKIFEITTTNITGTTTLGTQEVYAPDPSVVSVGTLESVSIQSHFSVPDGGISERVDNPIEGSVRFNDDLNTLEFYNGVEWRQFTVTGASGRAVFGGGVAAGPVYLSMIDYVHISSTGNAISFGDLSEPRRRVGGVSSETRGVFIRGTNPSNTRTNIMEYITIASGGNAISFGDGGVTGSTIGDGDGGCCSSSTRGIQAGGGWPSNHNIITYITIHTLGNALDFGDLSAERHQPASFSSPVRAIHYSGYLASSSFSSAVDTHLISSTGNAVDFADPLITRYGSNACSNSTRGIICGGNYSSPGTYISSLTNMNTTSLGAESFFGDLTVARGAISSTSSQVRGIFAGGYTPSGTNTIDYVTISSSGDAQDFGDLTRAKGIYNGMSDSHGGLGGF